jgi:hypothetical protein
LWLVLVGAHEKRHSEWDENLYLGPAKATVKAKVKAEFHLLLLIFPGATQRSMSKPPLWPLRMSYLRAESHV